MKQLVMREDRVTALIQQFAERHPRFSTKNGARGACKFASWELTKFLRRRGIHAKLVHLEGCKADQYPDAHPKWLDIDRKEWSHYVVKVGSVCYDLTAKQFDSNFTCPFTCNLAHLRGVWDTVESDHFLNTLVRDFASGQQPLG